MPRVTIKKKDYKLADFNAWVVGQMHTKHIKQSDLGQMLGLKQQCVSQRLNGISNWTLEEVMTIFHEFGTEKDVVSHLMIY